MKGWTVNFDNDFSPKKPVFIEGLPGIGNVGKIVVDYLIDVLKAKKVGSLFSYDLPNSVFVTENNLVTLPSIDVYYKRIAKQDFLFFTGDAQPSDERASFELSQLIIDLLEGYSCKLIITLGGIGLGEMPEHPKVFITGNDKDAIKPFVKLGADKKIFGVVGPIIGVSGLLLGLSKQHNIPAVSLLGETFGHPMHIGLVEAKKVITILDKQFSLKVDYTDIDEEIKLLQDEDLFLDPDVSTPKKSSKKHAKFLKYKDLNYIG